MYSYQTILCYLLALSTLFVAATAQTDIQSASSSSSSSLAPGQILIPAPETSSDSNATATTLAVSDITIDVTSNSTAKTDRATDILKKQYDGVLLINYAQTSCGVVFASSTYGFTAANCLIDSQTNATLDTTSLGIALYGPDATDLLSVVQATLHPSFDLATLANNVAVVQFQTTKLSKRDNEKSSSKDSSKKKESNDESNDTDDDNDDDKPKDEDNSEEESLDTDLEESSSVKESQKDNGSSKHKGSKESNTSSSSQTTSYSLSPISSSVADWKSIYYTRRTMASVPKRIWDPMQAKKDTAESSDQVCTVGSAIYAANTDAMLCSNVTMPALASEDQECQIPLSIVYGVQSSSSAGPLAIYSHSVVFGSGICSNFSQRHYYTLLSNYLEWGASVASGGSGSLEASTSSDLVSETETETPTDSTADSTQPTVVIKAGSVGGTDFSMNPPSGGSQEIYVYGGDLYPLIEAECSAYDAQISPTTTVTVHVTSTIVVTGTDTGAATDTISAGVEVSTPTPTDISGMTDTDMSGMTDMSGTDMSGMTDMSGTDMSGMTDMTGTDMSGMTDTTDTSATSASSDISDDNVVGSNVPNIVTVSSFNSSDMSMLGISDTDSGTESESLPTASSDADETDTDISDASASPSDTSNPDEIAQSNDQAKSKSMSTAAKVAIVVVVLLGLAAFGGGYWYYTRRRNKKKESSNMPPSEEI